MQPHEAFLSHSSNDKDAAEKIALLLRDHGVPTFYALSNVLGAQQWQDEILEALKRCDWFLVLVSPDAIDSMWVQRETAYALADRRYENRIVPLVYRDCDLGRLDWLKIFQLVDFRTDFLQGCRELLRIWGLALKT
jgi:hypothetical protein